MPIVSFCHCLDVKLYPLQGLRCIHDILYFLININIRDIYEVSFKRDWYLFVVSLVKLSLDSIYILTFHIAILLLRMMLIDSGEP